MSSPEPKCHLVGFGDNSVDLEARFWICDPHNGVVNVKSDFLLKVWHKFRDNEISRSPSRSAISTSEAGRPSRCACPHLPPHQNKKRRRRGRPPTERKNNQKNNKMNLYFRMIWLLIGSLFKPDLPTDRPTNSISLRVLPNDIDINMHMNNGRYLTICDLTRVDMFIRSGPRQNHDP